jgi:dTMP kinase
MGGHLFTLEGIEGSGKTTQAQALVQALRASGVETLLVREPGGTALGERIRALLLDRGSEGMTAETELFLYLAARAQLVAEIIRPALAGGGVVVCDRYGDASVAYQGVGRGIGARRVRDLNALATGGLAPELTVLLDLPVAEGLARTRARGQGRLDRLESEPDAFHERVRRGYLDAARAEPARFLVLDSRRPMDVLAEEIVEAVRSRISR